MGQNKIWAGYLSAFITILVWGTTFISTKVLLKSFAPIEILFFRFLLGFAVLLIAYPYKCRVTEKKQELIFASAGLCGITLYYLLENIALTYSMASNVGVIISVAPLFTAILAHFFLDEGRLQANFLLGFTAAISGIFLISYNGSTIFKLNPIGDLLAVMAAVVWAIYSIITRKISTYGYNTIAATRRTFFYGLVFMFPALFIFDFHFGFYRLTNEINIINILFLGLVASALCFVTWNFAVTKLGAVKTSIYIYMVPVITVITSMIVLNEKITPMAAVGTILTLLGLFISERRVYFKKKQIG